MVDAVSQDGFQKTGRGGFIKLINAISVAGVEHSWDQAVPGFEDVTGDAYLGTGNVYNTFGSVIQLGSALTLSAHPEVPEVSAERASKDPEEVAARVARLRKAEVLKGVRIIDLGCGKPNFALAATALGATVFTADLEPLGDHYGEQVHRHITVNLCEPEAVSTIEARTGTNLDMATESIIDLLPRQSLKLRKPRLDEILKVARTNV